MKNFSRTLFSAPSPFLSRHIKKKPPKWVVFFFRAGKGTRTLDPDLGKVVLYQLSYSRGVRPIIA